MKRELSDQEIQDEYMAWLNDKTAKEHVRQMEDYGELIPVDTMSKGTLTWTAVNAFDFIFDRADYCVQLPDIEFFSGHRLCWSFPMLSVQSDRITEGHHIVVSMVLVDWAEEP